MRTTPRVILILKRASLRARLCKILAQMAATTVSISVLTVSSCQERLWSKIYLNQIFVKVADIANPQLCWRSRINLSADLSNQVHNPPA